MRASECGHTDVVSLLLEAGADANANKKVLIYDLSCAQHTLGLHPHFPAV